MLPMGFEPGIYEMLCPRPPYVTIDDAEAVVISVHTRTIYGFHGRYNLPPIFAICRKFTRQNLPWGEGSAGICY